MSLFDILDLLGTASFAISGVLLAIRKKFDPFGVFIIGFVTAVGGGTLRDILIGHLPVTWMQSTRHIYVIIAGIVLGIMMRNQLKYISKSLFLFDTIGLGIFTIIGTEIGIQHHFSPIISISLGTITATFGGVLRDILTSRVPIIFKKEIYATPCIIGGVILVGMDHFDINTAISYSITTIVIISIRLIAIKYHLSLPPFYSNEKSKNDTSD